MSVALLAVVYLCNSHPHVYFINVFGNIVRQGINGRRSGRTGKWKGKREGSTKMQKEKQNTKRRTRMLKGGTIMLRNAQGCNEITKTER